MDGSNKLNLILAIVLSLIIIVSWQFFYERPRLVRISSQHKEYNEKIEDVYKSLLQNGKVEIKERADVINNVPRVKINTNKLKGSISLQGLRFDDLTLVGYKKDLSENSPDVELLSPSNTVLSYFAEIGWYSSENDLNLPNSDTLWQSNKSVLQANDTVTFTWVNKYNVKFIVDISVDDDYMFTIRQLLINNSDRTFSIQLYSLLHRNLVQNEKSINILHQGPISTINGTLNEVTYDDLKEKKYINYPQSIINWVGITDKYWLTSFIPDSKYNYTVNFTYTIGSGSEKYQVDFLSPKIVVNPNGSSLEVLHHLFAGAKKVNLLDYYAEKYNIKLFDRAIDFGWFYIITKPLFNALNFFYKYCGNFGVSILIVTVLIKISMFSLANKSYRSMKQMKDTQPEVEHLKELYGNDKIKFNQQVMELYKREKINPVSGCLPLLIQIPVFFSLYKVLYVTIEMRHAPFFGWIKDLSALDPTSVFNLFGLLPFAVPGILNIGAWPILMASTMMLQQKMSPAPTDPVQAQVIKFMPLIFLVMFSSFPAGLLIYWTWNNVLSIMQQIIINKLDKCKKKL